MSDLINNSDNPEDHRRIVRRQFRCREYGSPLYVLYAGRLTCGARNPPIKEDFPTPVNRKYYITTERICSFAKFCGQGALYFERRIKLWDFVENVELWLTMK